MKIIRFFLKNIILFVDFIIPVGNKNKLSDSHKNIFQKMSSNWKLYEFKACPFCIKVKRYLRSRNISLILVDAKNKQNEKELINGGGKRKVPCLYYLDNQTPQWLYESSDIIEFIENKIQNDIIDIPST